MFHTVASKPGVRVLDRRCRLEALISTHLAIHNHLITYDGHRYASVSRFRRIEHRSVPCSTPAHLENGSTTREVSDDFSVLSSDGTWRIRKIQKDNLDEIRRIVELQAEGFHIPNPLPFVDGLLKTSFKAEVLSEMQKKLKYNPSDKFVCLVVEPIGENVPVGVVEVSYIDEKEVLKSLEPGTLGVVYIASMTVSLHVRGQGAAKALLEAAEEVTKEWNEDKCVLHVYQDNTPAIELYKKRGFETIFGDAAWLAKVAVRPRYLMRKSIDDQGYTPV